MMKIGLLVNPLAGIGGPVALKGSDGAEIVEKALALGGCSKVDQRVTAAVSALAGAELDIITVNGVMGQNILQHAGLSFTLVDILKPETGFTDTTAADTRAAVIALADCDIDLLMFAGGDGTARDVMDALKQIALDETLTVVGIPAGCKIHSAVYAATPALAGELVALLASGLPMTQVAAQVMDLDENAFRRGEVKSHCYGYLQVPVDDTRMQLIKQGGVNHEAIALEEIAEEIVETMQDDVLYIIGSGTTTAAIMDYMALENTLLGVDVVLNRQLVKKDVSESVLLDLLRSGDYESARIIVTVIGGQGHIFGRGNQQLSAEVLMTVGLENIIIVATNEKLRTLGKRSLICDSGNRELDKKLSGLHTVITGYEQKTLMMVA